MYGGRPFLRSACRIVALTGEQAERAQLPCIIGKCDSDNARTRLASGDYRPEERADLEASAVTCEIDTLDPFDSKLVWKGCPAKLAAKLPEIRAALFLRGLGKLAPLSDYPQGYAAWAVDVWAAIEAGGAGL